MITRRRFCPTVSAFFIDDYPPETELSNAGVQRVAAENMSDRVRTMRYRKVGHDLSIRQWNETRKGFLFYISKEF